MGGLSIPFLENCLSGIDATKRGLGMFYPAPLSMPDILVLRGGGKDVEEGWVWH